MTPCNSGLLAHEILSSAWRSANRLPLQMKYRVTAITSQCRYLTKGYRYPYISQDAAGEKIVNFEMRVPAELVDDIERWRCGQQVPPPMAAAVRHLLETGLREVLKGAPSAKQPRKPR